MKYSTILDRKTDALIKTRHNGYSNKSQMTGKLKQNQVLYLLSPLFSHGY